MLQSQMTQLLKRCQLIDPKKLCISPGQAVWVLYLDVHVLDANGALLDACLLATLATLLDVRIPKVRVSTEGNVERSQEEDGATSFWKLQVGRAWQRFMVSCWGCIQGWIRRSCYARIFNLMFGFESMFLGRDLPYNFP